MLDFSDFIWENNMQVAHKQAWTLVQWFAWWKLKGSHVSINPFLTFLDGQMIEIRQILFRWGANLRG